MPILHTGMRTLCKVLVDRVWFWPIALYSGVKVFLFNIVCYILDVWKKICMDNSFHCAISIIQLNYWAVFNELALTVTHETQILPRIPDRSGQPERLLPREVYFPKSLFLKMTELIFANGACWLCAFVCGSKSAPWKRNPRIGKKRVRFRDANRRRKPTLGLRRGTPWPSSSSSRFQNSNTTRNKH